MEKRLDGKVAIITGASSGIGRAIACHFARHGAKVIVADVTTDVVEGGEATCDLIRRECGVASFVETDVAMAGSVDHLVKTAVTTHGCIDILVNNAAIHGGTPLAETDEAEFDRVMGVNLKGAYLCARAGLRQMLSQELVDEARGRIINISSQHGYICAPEDFAYGVSKAGIDYMTRQIAADYGKDNIVCNAVAPGKIITGKAGRAVEQRWMEYSRARTPWPRLGTPQDVANAALYLASAEATYLTGHTLFVDGGWMAA